MRHWLRLLSAAALASCAAEGPHPEARTASTAPPEPRVAPASDAARAAAIPLATLAGEPTDLARVARGKVTLVALWATWCDACAEELGALHRLDARTREGGDVVVVAIAVGEERGAVESFVRHHDVPATQLVDEDFRLADALDQRRVPATLILDRRGRIVFRGGALDGAALAALRAAIADPPRAP